MRGLIPSIAALLVAALLATVTPSFADDYVDREAIDDLLVQLADAPDPVTAQMLAGEVWQLWTNPDDPELNARFILMGAAAAQRNYETAIQMATSIIDTWPDYAEGWNQRATYLYIQGRYEESMADVEEVLAREPGHFGALAGAVLIHLAQDDRETALEWMLRALEVHPYLNERFLFPELLEPEVSA